MKQRCPICNIVVSPSARYPRCVCLECSLKTKTKEGRPLTFSNTHLMGGFESRFSDTGENYKEHECWVDGVKCWADEARFGGIVIQAIGEEKRDEHGNNI